MDVLGFAVLFYLSSYLLSVARDRELNGLSYKRAIIACCLLLIFPAAIRSNSVGTDIMVYQFPLYRIALNSSSLKVYYLHAFVADTEILYTLMIYFVTKICRSINAVFFIEECLIVFPIVYCIWKYRKKINPGYVLLAYDALFYFDSYNIIRQWLAISFGLVAFVKWDSNEKRKSIVLLLISILFHKTAVIMILIILFLEIYKRSLRKHIKYALIFFTACITLYVSLNYEVISKYLIRTIPFFRERYGVRDYLYRNEGANIPIINVLMWLVFLLILIIINKSEKDYFIEWNMMMILLSLVSIAFLAKASTAARAMLYIQVFSIFSAGYCVKIIKNSTKSRMIYSFLYGICLTGVWVYNIYIVGINEIFPYYTCFR